MELVYIALLPALAIVAMHLLDNFMTRSSKPAPTGLQVEKSGNSIALKWDNPNDDSITGYEYDYASFGVPFLVLPRWRGFNEKLVVRPSGGLLFEPHIRTRGYEAPKYPLYGKEIRVRSSYKDGERGKYISASIQDV